MVVVDVVVVVVVVVVDVDVVQVHSGVGGFPSKRLQEINRCEPSLAYTTFKASVVISLLTTETCKNSLWIFKREIYKCSVKRKIARPFMKMHFLNGL